MKKIVLILLIFSSQRIFANESFSAVLVPITPYNCALGDRADIAQGSYLSYFLDKKLNQLEILFVYSIGSCISGVFVKDHINSDNYLSDENGSNEQKIPSVRIGDKTSILITMPLKDLFLQTNKRVFALDIYGVALYDFFVGRIWKYKLTIEKTTSGNLLVYLEN